MIKWLKKVSNVSKDLHKLQNKQNDNYFKPNTRSRDKEKVCSGVFIAIINSSFALLFIQY